MVNITRLCWGYPLSGSHKGYLSYAYHRNVTSEWDSWRKYICLLEYIITGLKHTFITLVVLLHDAAAVQRSNWAVMNMLTNQYTAQEINWGNKAVGRGGGGGGGGGGSSYDITWVSPVWCKWWYPERSLNTFGLLCGNGMVNNNVALFAFLTWTALIWIRAIYKG